MYFGFFVLSALVFGPALSGEFLHWDDSTHILMNQAMHSGDIWQFWIKPYFNLYIPMIYSVWTAVYAVSSSPLAFHVLNLFIHAANCGLVFALALRFIPSATWLGALLGALVFCVHPLQAESVAWISGARDALSVTFALAALALVTDPLHGRDRRILAWASVLFLLGLFCKPTVAALPVAFACLPWVWRFVDRRRVLVMLAWAIPSAILLAVNMKVQSGDTAALLKSVDWWWRPVIALDAIGFYLGKFIWPWRVASDYGRIPRDVVQFGWYIWPVAGVLGLALVLSMVRALRVGWFYFAFFVVGLGAVLGLVPFMAQSQSTVADRYAYVPMIALAFATCHLVSFSTGAKSSFGEIPRRLVLGTLGLALVFWGATSFKRSFVYRDNVTFFTDMLDYNPNSFVAHVTKGAVEFARGRLSDAQAHFIRAHQLNPTLSSPLTNLARTYIQAGQFQRAVSEVERFIYDPRFIEANLHNKESLARMIRNVAIAHFRLDRFTDSYRLFCRAFEILPDSDEDKLEFEALRLTMIVRGYQPEPCPSTGAKSN